MGTAPTLIQLAQPHIYRQPSLKEFRDKYTVHSGLRTGLRCEATVMAAQAPQRV
jgi:hypothetical protein